jgi:simple sugar transport system permease protein
MAAAAAARAPILARRSIMSLSIEPRRAPSQAMQLLAPVLAVALTALIGLVLFAVLGHDPLATLYEFFVAPVSSFYGLGELAVKASPLTLCAIGLAIGFRANVWNIGAEGQFTAGAIAGSGVALYFWNQEGWFILPLMVLAGMLGGLAYAALPAVLKTRFDVNEILTSLMLTYIGTLLLALLVHGPWRDPEGYNFPQSRLFSEAETLPVLIEGTRLHLGVFAAPLVALAAWLVMDRTLAGFQVKVAGLAPTAARFAGFRRGRIVWACLLLSGALAGLAGIFEVAGPIGQLVPVISPGYGFTAIIVAFLGRLNPLGILIAAALMALTYIGGENAQIAVGLPQAVTGVFQGMLLFFLLACDVLVRYRIRFVAGKAAQPEAHRA